MSKRNVTPEVLAAEVAYADCAYRWNIARTDRATRWTDLASLGAECSHARTVWAKAMQTAYRREHHESVSLARCHEWIQEWLDYRSEADTHS